MSDFNWITPNLRHDMHDGSIADADRWLAEFVPPLLAYFVRPKNDQTLCRLLFA
ncbi:MAG: hypothetical protein ACXWKG_02085 [Limisphaerales bacterium]